MNATICRKRVPRVLDLELISIEAKFLYELILTAPHFCEKAEFADLRMISNFRLLNCSVAAEFSAPEFRIGCNFC